MVNPTASAGAAWHPRVFVGVPTGSLNPEIPSPVYRPSPVALELAPGIGFAVDGESLVVGDAAGAPDLSIVGHLDDGTYPQRDFTVSRSDSGTRVNGYFDWQTYRMKREGNQVDIQASTPDFSSTVTQSSNGIQVAGNFPAQKYDIPFKGDETDVNGYDDNESARILYAGNKIDIQGNIPERCFEITRTGNGFHVEGAYQFQDFDVALDGHGGFTIQGLYPQQHYVVTTGAGK